jgi:hypothetical protein
MLVLSIHLRPAAARIDIAPNLYRFKFCLTRADRVVQLNRFNAEMHRRFESVQAERRLVMIPASYLYKDAFEQHWGRDFARVSGERPWEAHTDAGHWESPSLFRTIRDLASLALAPARRDTAAGARPCPEAVDCPPMAA